MSKNAIKDLSQAGKDMTDAAGRVAIDLAHELEEKVEVVKDDVVERAIEKKKTAEKYFKQHPWKALGITAGIGFFMALLFGRAWRS
jgi:ElaB/YqjD/DUF883 family membrane-anchored ribosome-binding protein